MASLVISVQQGANQQGEDTVERTNRSGTSVVVPAASVTSEPGSPHSCYMAPHDGVESAQDAGVGVVETRFPGDSVDVEGLGIVPEISLPEDAEVIGFLPIEGIDLDVL